MYSSEQPESLFSEECCPLHSTANLELEYVIYVCGIYLVVVVPYCQDYSASGNFYHLYCQPAYLNLLQKVETACSRFLSKIPWSTSLNKNQLRTQLRDTLNE